MKQKMFLALAVLVILLVSGCVQKDDVQSNKEGMYKTTDYSQGKFSTDGIPKYKEYIFIESNVLNTTQQRGGGNLGYYWHDFVTIQYDNKYFEISTGEGSQNKCWNQPGCHETSHYSGFKPKINDSIFIEAIYDNQNKDMRIIGVYNRSIEKPDKSYIYDKVNVTDVKRLFRNYNGTFFTSEKFSDCKDEILCEIDNIEEQYILFFEYRGMKYNFTIKRYDLCTPDFLSITTEEENKLHLVLSESSVENYSLNGEIQYKIPYGFKPIIGEEIIIEGLFDQKNNYLVPSFFIYDNKVYTNGGYWVTSNNFNMDSVDLCTQVRVHDISDPVIPNL